MNATDDDELSTRSLLAAELKRQRERAGWTLMELSERSRYDPSYLQRLETGTRLGSHDVMVVLDRLYDTGDLLSKLWRKAKREDKQRRYQGFAELEAEATGIQAFSANTVPGLLQTPGYAEELLRSFGPDSEEQLASQVHDRMSRQDRLTGVKPLNYRALLDESVIRRPTLRPSTWTEQVQHLIDAAQRPNITLHVVPLNAGLHSLLGGSLQLLWLPSGQTIAYVEGGWSGQLISEIEEVEHFRLSYDRVRDSALSPAESLELLRSTLEGQPSCTPPDQT
ncbi:helix-turn-helix transcriptional regulator [Actinacidiphila sp. DG2A-62]|uniref:helix-turn-helix domain-containing protein n=1 Tax=Actinacidiphila sp. DG2A-62 TaxID=3108821 RepID=UPI002DB944B4|nr:helix-turn-helix transcriptional regulator [Actinacidiphila sp. DG2A-62]MEC3996549.1 helix-turn-helix transcriptional regulator [Actinacidiphila sp. DG2A-62]